MRRKVAILGPGHAGTDLLAKLARHPGLEPVAVAGRSAAATGLALARELGIAHTDRGVRGLAELGVLDDVAVVLDATTASAHRAHAAALAPHGVALIDLTPAALAPAVVPSVNLDEHRDGTTVSLVGCSAQATVPLVHAVTAVAPVRYTEVVTSLPAPSVGPGTRANLDELTVAGTAALRSVGGSPRARAVTVLSPADPPTAMRNTVLFVLDDLDDTRRAAITAAVTTAAAGLAGHVPGYRLTHDVQFAAIPADEPLGTLVPGPPRHRWKVSVFTEVTGAGDHLPGYAGNLDVMSAAAIATACRIAVPTAGSTSEVA